MSMEITLWQLVTVILVMMGSVAGLLKYVFYLLEQHKNYIDQRFKAQDSEIHQIKTDIKANATLASKVHEDIHAIREELYSGYVKGDSLEKDFNKIMNKMDDMFEFLTKLSRDVHYLKGKSEGMDNDRK